MAVALWARPRSLIQRIASGGRLRRLTPFRLAAENASASVDAHRDVAVDGRAADDAVGVSIVIDPIVLRRPIVPDRDVLPRAIASEPCFPV